MVQQSFRKQLIAGILVAFFFAVALFLRVVLPFDKVFVGDWIKFTGVDAYFLMHIVDNLAHNFPHLNSFDPYLLYPAGGSVSLPPFFVYFLGGIIWLIGLGSPAQHVTDIVGVYFPAILGALTVIPVYFIGKTLSGRWAGVMAAGLVGIFPGEFLGRSILGFADYHVAEVLFTTITMMFLVLAVKNAKQKGFSFTRDGFRDWKAATKPLLYSLFAGIFLGIYALTWPGALLFVFIIFAYLVIQFVIDHLRKASTEYLGVISIITFIVALAISQPVLHDPMSEIALIIAIVVTILLAAVSYFMAKRGVKAFVYPAVVLGLGLVGLAIFYAVNRPLFDSLVGSFGIFTWATGTTVLEMQPLLFPGGVFSFSVAWGNFTTSSFLAVISLGVLIFYIVRKGETDKTLVVVWSLVILAATLSMRRFAYYFAVNVALLTGYLSWLILEFAGFKKVAAATPQVLMDPSRNMKKKAKYHDQPKGQPSSVARKAIMAVSVIIIFFLSFFPNVGSAINGASYPPYAPSDAWYESLSWMKDNTPDPFGNPQFYYDLYSSPGGGEKYEKPRSAYGVTAWWDYGYWIIRIAHRVPTSTPGTGHQGEAYFFVAQDETSANKILLNTWGSKYIVVDYATAIPMGGKFYAVATLSGNTPDKFYDVYYQVQNGIANPVLVFFPEYYRSLLVRLYNFDGKGVVPTSAVVVSYEARVTPDGQPYKEITSAKSFPTYEGAEAYIANQSSGNYKIVSTDPFVSPVPLEPLEHYKLIHASKGARMMPSGDSTSEVKIFEYIK